MNVLTGKGTPGTVSYFDSPNPEMNARFQRFYAAHVHLANELRREASIAAARGRRVKVVVVLGTPPSGSVAAVLRRASKSPTNVIVLGPEATGETLGAAFVALDQWREAFGDDLNDDYVVAISDARATSVDPKQIEHMNNMVAKLRSAPTRQVDGVGDVRAIDMTSRPLP